MASLKQQAWSTLDIKSVDRAQRVIEGIASTPTPDRGGDSLDPMGAEFSLPMPFLWKHKDPVGEVFYAVARPDGIHMKARVSAVAVDAPTVLKDRIEEAWHSMSAKPPLVRGLSVGWSPLEAPTMVGQVRRFAKWVLGEVSAVVVPMNAEATILSVKSFDSPHPAAPGTGSGVRSPGVTGSSDRKHTMNTSEKLTSAKADLQTKAARLEELMNDDDQGNGLDAEQSAERNTLITEVKSMTETVSRLSTLEAAQAAQAGAVGYETNVPARIPAGRPTATRVEFKTAELPKGTLFTRYAMSIAAGKGSHADTLAYAKRWTSTPEVLQYIKSTEGVAFLNSPSWGSELVNPNTMQTEFVELLRAMTIVGRVPGFRMVPFNIPIITQTGGSTFEWVGEGGVKPVGELAFDRTTMPTSKVAGIIVITEELVRLSTPSAEATVRQDLTEQCARFIDEQFIRAAVSAGPNNPASITNGVTAPGAASGTDINALLADLAAAFAIFDNANIPTDNLVIVTTPAIARGISLMISPLGNFQFPGMQPNGGTLLGYPVVVSNSVDSGTLVIFKPSEIFLADDGRVTLDASNQATLSMAGGSPFGAPDFNLWQRNCIGIRAEEWIRWQKRRDNVVAVITGAAYGPAVGSP